MLMKADFCNHYQSGCKSKLFRGDLNAACYDYDHDFQQRDLTYFKK